MKRQNCVQELRKTENKLLGLIEVNLARSKVTNSKWKLIVFVYNSNQQLENKISVTTQFIIPLRKFRAGGVAKVEVQTPVPGKKKPRTE
jgi:hypothetical protein